MIFQVIKDQNLRVKYQSESISGSWLPARSNLPLPHHRGPDDAAVHLHLLPLACHVPPRHRLDLPRGVHYMQPSQSDHVLRCKCQIEARLGIVGDV